MAISLRIELSDIEPLIWRKLNVPNDIGLDELHLAIQGTMGWENSHLHMFIIDNKQYEMKFDDGFPSEMETLDEREFRLSDLVKSGGKLEYIYDFGDDWHHKVIVEAVSDEAIDGPICTGGERACPPEDCGGPYGYPELLDALGDKSHPNHKELMEWAGEFDPEAFDHDQANSQIKFIQSLVES